MQDNQIIQNSIMGAVFLITVIPLGLYTKSLIKTLKEIQDKRVADSKEVADKLLATSEQWNNSLSEQVRAVSTLESTLRDVKDALREVREDLRDRPSRR